MENNTSSVFTEMWSAIWEIENDELAVDFIYDTRDNIITHGRQYDNKSLPWIALMTFFSIITLMMGFFMVAVNLLVVVSSGLLLRRHQEPKSTYILLGNVAMADLVLAFAIVFGRAFPQRMRTHTSCSISIAWIVASIISSVYTVALIAIDRFIYILHGLKYQHWVSANRVRCLILLTWIVGFLIGFAPMMGWGGDTQGGRNCWFVVVLSSEAILLTSAFGAVPIIAVILLYSVILYRAIKKSIELNNMKRASYKMKFQDSLKLRAFRGGQSIEQKASNNNHNNPPLQLEAVKVDSLQENAKGEDDSNTTKKLKSRIMKVMKKSKSAEKNHSKWKAIKVVVFTTGGFIITWVPFFTGCILYALCDPAVSQERCRKIMIAVGSPLTILASFNSLLNPLIYAWWNNGFRTSIQKIVKKTTQKLDRIVISNHDREKSRSLQVNNTTNVPENNEFVNNRRLTY